MYPLLEMFRPDVENGWPFAACLHNASSRAVASPFFVSVIVLIGGPFIPALLVCQSIVAVSLT